MNDGLGVPAAPSGHSRAEPEEVSALRASVPNACDCHKCAGACEHKPGWFKPDQIASLAAALGLSEKELFNRFLQVDWWEGNAETDYEDVFILSPGIIDGDIGGMFDRDPRGTCVWFQDGKCAIHAAGKPFECAQYHHSDKKETWYAAHKGAGLSWNTPEAQAKVAELLGREPEVTGSWGLLDTMLGGGWPTLR